MANYLHLALVGSAGLRVTVAHLPTVSTTTVPAMNLYMHSTEQLGISSGSTSNAMHCQKYTFESQDFAPLLVMIAALKQKKIQ